jgi:hypothetical protein
VLLGVLACQSRVALLNGADNGPVLGDRCHRWPR